MLRVENIETFGFVNAMRGMRNPMNSWGRQDSYYADGKEVIGPNDLDLLLRLTKAGTEHRKALRMMHIQMDITAPLYWWKEFDTYKVGTTANSCSTMHKIQTKEFVLDDFSHEHLDVIGRNCLEGTITMLNTYRDFYNESKDKDDWWGMIQLLPSSYNQTRTVDINYEVALNMLRQRKSHKLDEWIRLCNTIVYEIPYLMQIAEASK